MPANPTLEQLKTGLKTKKTDCAALLANYQCGQNEILSVPSGDIIQPNVGDEIAINSIGFEVVELDGSGNGRGIVKVPMFQNAKFGVEFKGIKVAKGGCVVAGQAELSNVDVALLNEEQRKKLAETYEVFNKILDVVDANAEGVAETFNSVWALMDGIKDRAAKLAAKLSGGQNPTAKEIKDLAKLTENSAAMLQKSLNDIKKQAQANADAGKVDEMQKIIDQQKASAKALLASAKDIKVGKDKLPTPQDPMEKANTQKQVDALAMTNGAEVKKKLDGLKGTSSLMIEYNKIPYANGKTITISNKEAVSGFTLKNIIEGEDLAWVVKDGDKVLNNFTANPVGLMWPDGTIKLTLEATQGSRKMSLTLQRKTFIFTGLIAIDKNSPSRRTKLADETLYIVRSNNTSRTINYVMTTNAKKNDFVGIEPNWNTIIPLNNLYEGKVLTGINSKTAETRHTSESKGSVSAEAFDKKYNVKVEVVDESRFAADFMPAATSALLTTQYDEVKNKIDQFNKTFEKFGTTWKVEVKPLKIKGEKYNEEEAGTRFYNKVLKGNINGGISVKPKDDFLFYPPILKPLNIKGVSECGFYLSPKFEINLIGVAIKMTNGETNIQKKDQFLIEFNPKGCMEGGVKFKSLVAQDYLEVDIKGFSEVCLSGKVDLMKYFNKEPNYGQILIDPFVVGIKAKVKAKYPLEFTFVDFQGTYAISPKYQIYPSK